VGVFFMPSIKLKKGSEVVQISPTVLTVIGCLCSIVAFFIGQYAGIKKNGYEQGKRDSKIDVLSDKLDEIAKEIKEWNMGALIQRVIALEKAVFRKSGDSND
jgi:hypothetical protein